MDNQMSTFCYRDTELNSNGNISVLRALNGKEIHFNRKRKFFGDPPKPDTPPVSEFFECVSFIYF